MKVFYELLRHKVGFAFLRAVIWAGLKHEDQALTLESVGNLIQAKLHALDDDGDRQKLIADMTEVCFEALRSQGVLGRRRTPEPGTPVIDVLKSRPTSAVVGAQEAAATVVGEAIEAAPPPERD